MKLSAEELAQVRAQGAYIAEKCDGCGKVLNQSVRYTVKDKPEVYCSAACRDFAFFGDRHAARKHSTPGRCAYCNATLVGKRRDAHYCDDACKKLASRHGTPTRTREAEKAGTATVQIQ